MVSCKDLSFTYPEAKVPALSRVTLNVKEGEFVLICGKSGCGKTTLLRQWKLPPNGTTSGEVMYQNKPMEQADDIGYLFQHPEHQIVTDMVWHELAFGLENMGLKSDEIRLRVAETAQFFGLQEQFDQKISTLSGGQKQLLNLAAIMAMRPKVLLLDEPTAQLDPIAKERFLDEIKRINTEVGITVVMTEHNLEKAAALADRIVVMEAGAIVAEGKPQKIGAKIKDNEVISLMPTPMQVQLAVNGGATSPISIKEGKSWLKTHIKKREITIATVQLSSDNVLFARELYFRYDKEGKDTIKDFSLTVPQGCIYAMTGENGSGKSTALHLLAGLQKPIHGDTAAKKSIALLPQDPQAVFLKNTVEQDLEMFQKDITEVVGLTHLEPLLDRHPYDLSAGEQQRAALAKILLIHPDILLLDEPTKGLDALFQREVSVILKQLAQQGTTIVLASHNLEFCAQTADVCGLLFDGQIVSQGEPHMFFSSQTYYTTAAHKMAGEYCKQAITTEEVISLCQ